MAPPVPLTFFFWFVQQTLSLQSENLVVPETSDCPGSTTHPCQHRDTTPLKEWRCSSFEISAAMKKITACNGRCAPCATELHGQGSVLCPSNTLLFRSVPCLGAPWAASPLPIKGWDYGSRQHKTSSLQQGGGEMSEALAALFLASWTSSAHSELTFLIFPEEVLS